nr:hypothetical protein [Tanacetum cinerariifolium]
FANMRRVGKGFSGVKTPLFENMLAIRAVDAEEEVQVKSSKLKRLKKIGTSQCVESSEDVENVFNQGRMNVDMEIDKGIELEVDQEKDDEVEGRHADTQAEIYNIDLDHSSKVVTAATLVAAASAPILTAKPKVLKIAAAAPAVSTRRRKGVVFRDTEEELHIDTPAETPTIKGYKMEFFKGKTYDQILPVFQARFDANMKFLFKTRKEMEKEDEEIIKSINETPAQKAAKRRKLTDNLRGHLEIVPEEDDDVFVEAIPLAQKAPVMDYQVVVIDNRPRYTIIRADDTHQLYISFINLLKNFDREDLEALWRIVKDRFSTKKPTNFSHEYLLLTLKTMFGELDKQDAIWRNQKSVHGLALVKR